MGPGLGAERVFGYPAVAERFAAAGFAVFLFDYRHHGESDGRPRRLVSPAKQRADYAAAIDCVSRVETVDSDRIVLWGHSLSGGHSLVVAGERTDIAAVVTIAPFTDGRMFLRTRSKRYILGALHAGILDSIGHTHQRISKRIATIRGGSDGNGKSLTAPRGMFSRDVPIVGDVDEIAAISEPATKRPYLDLVDRESDWENSMPARGLLELVRYRPVKTFDTIDAETFVLVPRSDQIIPESQLLDDVDTITNLTTVLAPADHFSPLGSDFEAVMGYQRSFLTHAFPDR